MRDIDFQAASQSKPHQQPFQPPTQQQRQQQIFQGSGIGPGGPVPRVPFNQTTLTVQQLQDMAYRQQQQIEQQQHLLVAKEQRLKYLRQQDMSHHQLAAEYERLRRLREKVEAQEMKLRKLRSLRGTGSQHQQQQQQQQQPNKNAVLADLESIRALFNEKEKELSQAVRRVEDLTHQLEDLRSGRLNGGPYPPQVVELERLRRELVYRKQLSEQQNQMIAQQRAQLAVGREEIARIDSRVLELQERLERKRMMNQQLANQISAATSAKQEQIHAIQQNLMLNRNKNKPVSTVEPIQRQMHVGGQVPKVVEDLHNSINKNQHFSDEKDSTKYQTLPFGSRYNNMPKAELTTNGRYAEAPPGNYPRPYSLDHQGNYAAASGIDNLKSNLKPVSSVAPLMQATTTTTTSDGQPTGKAKPALPPKPLAPSDRNGSVSPPPYIPAPPPGSDSSITIKQFSNENNNSMHPSEEGTSVDDDMPSEEDETGNGTNGSLGGGLTVMPNVHISINRRIEMPPAFRFPENQPPPSDLLSAHKDLMLQDVTDNSSMYPAMMQHIYNEYDHLSPEEKSRMSAAASEAIEEDMLDDEDESGNRVPEFESDPDLSRPDKPVGIIKRPKLESEKTGGRRGVSFDPLALLLDASLEGELELVKRTAREVSNPSAANDEGITALHNAICAGHFEIVKFLVEFGCDVNAPDSDGWTPLHCAASCNNLPMVRFLVEHGACVFATTLSDHETAAEKCEEDEEGFDGCSEYLYGIQEKIGLIHGGDVYAVYNYERCRDDELSFKNGDLLTVIRKTDETETEWWWSKLKVEESGLEMEGYVPRNLLGLFPRVTQLQQQPQQQQQHQQHLESIQEETKDTDSTSSREEDDAAMASN